MERGSIWWRCASEHARHQFSLLRDPGPFGSITADVRASAAVGIKRAIFGLICLEAVSRLCDGKSYAWPLTTSPYLPAGNTNSSVSGLIIRNSEPSPNGATLKSYDMLRMVHVFCAFVVLAWPALNVMSRRTFAIARTETRSGAVFAASRR
jgi:hypothetical protein